MEPKSTQNPVKTPSKNLPKNDSEKAEKMRGKCIENGAETGSNKIMFLQSSFSANHDYSWSVCKKTRFALQKTDAKTMENP